MSTQSLRSPLASAAALTLLLASTGCAHVKRQELQTEMTSLRDQVRSEYRAGDRELGARIGHLDNRVGEQGRSLAAISARTTRLEGELVALANEFETTVERIDSVLAFNAPVYFDYDSSEVRVEDREVLDRFAAVVNQHYPESLVTVEGFADPAGPTFYNLALGGKRAESVRVYLIESGSMDPLRIRAVSYGEAETRQVVPGASGPEEGMPNRRVTLVIDTAGGQWDLSEPVEETATPPTDDGSVVTPPTDEVVQPVTPADEGRSVVGPPPPGSGELTATRTERQL